MTGPRLGIITTAFNHAEYLPGCIASVVDQTSTDFVHVIVDDASPDGIGAIVDEWARTGERRIGVRLATNRGLAGAFHAGVELLPPSVEWILKVDADDKIDARYVAEILRAADADPARNVIFAPCQHFGTRSDIFVYPPFDPRTMREVFQIPGPAAYRRTLWDAVGGYDVTMRSAEDWDFYIRAHEAVGLLPYQIREPNDLYWYYRMHSGQRASSEGIKRIRYLRAYWQGHTRETALAGSRSWGAWCAEREVAA